jgi:hypothetical protein
LKKAHLQRYAANLIAQRISIYASRSGFGDALHLNLFEQPEIPFLNQALSLLAASSASSTYVQYASSPPPSRRDIIIDLEME